MLKNLAFEKLLKDFNMGYTTGSQAKFAKKMGVSPQLINYWVKGKTVPSDMNMKKLSKILNKDIKDIQKIFINNEKNKNTNNEENINLKMIIKLMEKQNNAVEEKMKRLETEIELLKKDFDIFKLKSGQR